MNINKYFSVTNLGFKEALVYRFNFILSIFTTPLSLVIFYFLWKSIFEYSGMQVIRGFTLQTMISYYAINMLVGFIIWTYVDEDLEEKIIDGTLTPQLLRPLDYFWEIFSQHIGYNAFIFLVTIIPITIIAAVFFGLKLPSLINGIFFLILLVFAVMANFITGYLAGLTSFWLKRISGIRRLRRVVISFLAGSFLPLNFFPDWVAKISNFLPFQYMRYVPITVYLGKYTTPEILWLVLGAAVWTVALYFISKKAWKYAYRQFAGSGT